jgi:hypothetical protein
LSPEDNDAPEVGWFATSLRRIDLATFHSSRTQRSLVGQLNDLESASVTTQPTESPRKEKKVKAMLIPVLIFLMILSPVLIPTAVTIVNVMQGNHRPAGAAPRRFFAVPAAA